MGVTHASWIVVRLGFNPMAIGRFYKYEQALAYAQAMESKEGGLWEARKIVPPPERFEASGQGRLWD